MTDHPIAVIGNTVDQARTYADEVLKPGWKAFNIRQHNEVAMSKVENFVICPDTAPIPEPMLNALVMLMRYRWNELEEVTL